MAHRPDTPPGPTATDYREAAALREGLRRFMRRSEEIAAAMMEDYAPAFARLADL